MSYIQPAEDLLVGRDPQLFTENWENLVEDIFIGDFSNFTFFVEFEQNDSQGLQFQFFGKDNLNSKDYLVPILSVAPDIVKVNKQIFEFETGLAPRIAFPLNFDKTIQYTTIQIKALKLGAIPAKILAAKFTLSQVEL